MKAPTAKQARFVDEYLIDLDRTKAAIRAGYSKKTAGQIGYELLLKPHVAVEIAKRQAERAKRTEIDQDFVLKHWARLVQADPNELTSMRVFACRHCHGTDHGYQWRTEAEYERALEAHWELPDEQRSKRKAPTISGGYGYSTKLHPVETCPECDGLGRQQLVVGDTTRLSDEAKVLFAGVKETQSGIEIKMHDQMAALVNVAKHLGMFPSKVELTGKDGGPIQTEEVSARDIITDRLNGIAARTRPNGASGKPD